MRKLTDKEEARWKRANETHMYQVELARLEDENKKLKEDNTALKIRLAEVTGLLEDCIDPDKSYNETDRRIRKLLPRDEVDAAQSEAKLTESRQCQSILWGDVYYRCELKFGHDEMHSCGGAFWK